MSIHDLTLGRVVVPGFDLTKLDHDGDAISLSGKFRAGTLDETLALRDGLCGYGPHNLAEDVVPFSIDQDPRLTGFVVPARVPVASTRTSLVGDDDPAAPWFDLDLQLLKVPGWKTPTAEVRTDGVERDGSAVTGVPWVAVPGSGLSKLLSGVSVVPTWDEIDLVGGGSVAVLDDAAAADGFATYLSSVGSHYEGAATLTIDGEVVVGTQIPETTDGWVISNGLVQVRPSLTEANHLVVGVRNAAAAGYDEVAYRLVMGELSDVYEMGFDGTDRYGPIAFTVTRCDPTTVAVRVTYTDAPAKLIGGPGTVSRFGYDLDIAVRRGAYWADCSVATATVGAGWGVYRATADASADVTGGVQDAAAVSGAKWQIQTPQSIIADNTNGGLRADPPVSRIFFGLGNDRDLGPGADTFRGRYAAAMRHRQRMVAR